MRESSLLNAYREHETELIAYLTRRMRSAFNARDVAQDLCVKICSEHVPLPESNVRGYLFRMAANLATDFQRRETRNHRLADDVKATDSVGGASPSPEELIISRDQLRQMESMVQDMPELSRRIFHMSRFEGLTQREIARAVGLSPAGVFKRLRNVLDELARIRDET